MYNLDEPDIEVYMEVKRILKKWKKEEPIFIEINLKGNE